MSRTVAIIQARLGSTRLPRKVLSDICGKPMLQHVIDRALAIHGVDHVVVTVPYEDHAEFVKFIDQGPRLSLDYGPGEDVLRRYWLAATNEDADVIVRLTSDCPLIAPEVCEKVLRSLTCRYGFASNDTRQSGYPDGLDCQVFRWALLDKAHEEATSLHDREHVCPWMEANGYAAPPVKTRNRNWPKVSVDSQDDFDRVRRIMARIPAGDYSWQATQEAIRAELSKVS